MATVTVIHSEKRAFGPALMLSMFRLDDIQNDWNSILIIASDQALVGVCSVSPHNAVSSQAAFSCFMVGNDNSSPRLKREFPCIILIAPLNSGILMKHLIDIQSGEALNFGVNPSWGVKLLLNTYVLLVLLKECFQIQFCIRLAPDNWGGLRPWIMDILGLAFLRMMLESWIRISRGISNRCLTIGNQLTRLWGFCSRGTFQTLPRSCLRLKTCWWSPGPWLLRDLLRGLWSISFFYQLLQSLRIMSLTFEWLLLHQVCWLSSPRAVHILQIQLILLLVWLVRDIGTCPTLRSTSSLPWL